MILSVRRPTARHGKGKRALALGPLAALITACVLTIVATPGDAARLDPIRALRPPGAGAWLGCGEGGVDLLAVVARGVVWGSALACAVALLGFAIGTPLGASAALRRGRTERFVERACDLVQAFPTFILALAVLSSVRSPSRVHLAAVFALTAWAPFARLALVETRVLRSQAFIEAAFALGMRPSRVLVRHLLPNLLPTVAVQLGASAAAIVVSEAALAFLGFGPKDGVSLGAVLDQGVAFMLAAPHVLVVASTFVFLTSGALIVAGAAVGPAGPSRRG